MTLSALICVKLRLIRFLFEIPEPGANHPIHLEDTPIRIRGSDHVIDDIGQYKFVECLSDKVPLAMLIN
ncbi:hypothetical protein SAMN05421690_101071 [Nitrosomonas sp. Nm51]|nr:hypothetical protein SAMN05421690_101071 [Nitrosomonas sp. Nm51]